MSAANEAVLAVQAAHDREVDEFAALLRPVLYRLGERQYYQDHRYSLKPKEPPELTSEEAEVIGEVVRRLQGSATDHLQQVASALSRARRSKDFIRDYQESLDALPDDEALKKEADNILSKRDELKVQIDRLESDLADVRRQQDRRKELEGHIRVCEGHEAQAESKIGNLLYYVANPDRASSTRPGFRRSPTPWDVS